MTIEKRGFPTKLDIGCGIKPRGDVNVDLHKGENPYRRHEGISSVLNTRAVPNFVLADACHLPFRDNTFDKILSISTLEHIKDYFRALKEMWRVCKSNGGILIETEHRLGGFLDLFRLRRKGARTENRFSRAFFLKTFGVSHIEHLKTSYELFGIPTGIRVLIRK